MGIVDDLQKTYPPSKPRYRSKGTFTAVGSVSQEKDRNCTFGTVNSPRNVAVNGEVLQTWDVLTPNYRKRSRAGEMITNPFRSLLEQQTTSGTFFAGVAIANSCGAPVLHQSFDISGPEAYWRYSSFEPSLRVARPILLSSADIAAAQTVASTAAWEKSNFHSADVLVDIAEFSKTLRMLRDPIQSGSALFRKIRSGKRGAKDVNVNDVVDYANSLWLQYRYGIRPLVKSVQGVVKALETYRNVRRRTHRGSYSLKSTNSTSGSVPGTIISFNYQISDSDEVSIRTGLVIDEIISLGQELGVDGAGMLQLPWELVPFSFVADWFANTNHFLGAIVPYLTKNPLSSWITTRRLSSRVFNVTGSSIVPTWTMTRAVTETRSGVFLEKTRIPSLQGPSITYKPQAIQKVYNDLRIIDAFALLHKQFLSTFKV